MHNNMLRISQNAIKPARHIGFKAFFGFAKNMQKAVYNNGGGLLQQWGGIVVKRIYNNVLGKISPVLVVNPAFGSLLVVFQISKSSIKSILYTSTTTKLPKLPKNYNKIYKIH